MRLEKQKSRQRWSEVTALFNEWDPIGIVGENGPYDEYDCLVGPVLRMLENGASEGVIAEYLRAESTDHFGLQFSGVPQFAARVARWYAEKWAGSTS